MSVHDDRLTWRQIGFQTDSTTLTFHNDGGDLWRTVETIDSSCKRSYQHVFHAEPGHTYMLSVDYMVDGTDGGSGNMLSLQLDSGTRSELDVRVPLDAGKWQTVSTRFTVPSTMQAFDAAMLVYSVDTHKRTWVLRNLCYADITSEAGGVCE